MKKTYVYSDGSVFNNQRRESHKTFGGVGVFFGDNDRRNVSEPFFEFPITNNRTEIKAAILAIQNFMNDKIKRKNDEKEILVIYSDSQYLINSITKWINKWKLNYWKTANGKPVLNKDLLFQLDHLLNLYKDYADIQFKFVKAHREGKNIPKDKTSIEFFHWYGNMMADTLAKNGTLIAVKASEKK
jgi:ribonuclease HI